MIMQLGPNEFEFSSTSSISISAKKSTIRDSRMESMKIGVQNFWHKTKNTATQAAHKTKNAAKKTALYCKKHPIATAIGTGVAISGFDLAPV